MHQRALDRNLTRGEAEPAGNVVVLHGSMGAALARAAEKEGDRPSLIWLQALPLISGGVANLALDPTGERERDPGCRVQTAGILKRYYGELLMHLSQRWRVQAFAYDWRKDLRTSADELAAAIERWFPAEPVHLVAHSMGGLVARAFVAAHPEQWAAMCDGSPDKPGPRGGRLIMLGVPNQGSYDVPRGIAGLEEHVRLLALADLRLGLAEVREVLNTFPGTFQMLPSPAVPGAEPLYLADTYDGAAVSQRHLDAAKAVHELLAPVADPARMVAVAGSGQRTVVGLDTAGVGDPSAYQYGTDGDGRVPHALGDLPGVTRYFAPVSHGALTSDAAVLDAVGDLLLGGRTKRLKTKPPASRGGGDPASLRATAEREAAEDEARMRESMRRLGSRDDGTLGRGDPPASAPVAVSEQERHVEDLVVRDWLGLRPAAGETEPGGGRPVRKAKPPAIEIGLWNGNVGQAHTAPALAGFKPDVIAVGHYEGVQPQAAEAALDFALSEAAPRGAPAGLPHEGLIAHLSLRGTITGQLGQPFVLPDPRRRAGGRLIMLAGMGVPGRFGTGELTLVARELCWAAGRIGRRHVAAVLIGAGTGNLPPADAITAWMRGIAQALNGQIADSAVRAVTFVEFDARRLHEIDEALGVAQRRMAEEQRLIARYTPADAATKEKWRRRALATDLEAARRRWREGAERDHKTQQAPARITITREGATYRFGAITAKAAIPEREVPLDPNLVKEANDQLAAEPDATRRREHGRYLSRLLFPGDLGPQLSGSPVILMLDSTTARIHWELVTRADAMPSTTPEDSPDWLNSHLGIGAAVTRQLRTAFAPPPEPPPPPERLLRVLVIADPAEDAHLPGAEEEGIKVAELFEKANRAGEPPRVEVVALLGPREATRTAVLEQLILKRFHVLHFAGHCFYDAKDPAGSGWIFTGGQTIAARELRRIDRVPEFVFSNACESGITPDRSGRRSAALAPSFAESFFARGVGNFVCTAWPVDDHGARLFATTLYRSLLGQSDEPQPMFKAMSGAREEVAGASGGGARSWGAYQHYGDPLFRLFSTQATVGR